MKTPILYVLLFLPFLSLAQAEPCKARLKANRGHVLTMGKPEQEASRFSFGDRTITIYDCPGDDSVYIYNKGRLFSAFTVSGNEITSSYNEYDADKRYMIMKDSINPQKGRHKKTYPLFASNHVVSSQTFYPNQQPAVYIYYSLVNGSDSVRKEWYHNGLPRLLEVYETPGSSFTYKFRMHWDSSGILRNSHDAVASASYYPNGIIQTRILHAKPGIATWYNEEGIIQELSYDTLISGITCRYKKTFYPTGILKNVEYYCSGTPCLTWGFYSPEGILKQSIKKGPLVTGPNEPEPVPEEPLYDHVRYVEQVAEFPGGHSKLMEYMKGKLDEIICKSEVELKDSYRLHFYIRTDGKPVFAKIEGFNADRLNTLFSSLFESMPLWRAGKRQGLYAQDQYVAILSVEKKKP